MSLPDAARSLIQEPPRDIDLNWPSYQGEQDLAHLNDWIKYHITPPKLAPVQN